MRGPTAASPGSDEKIEVLTQRLEADLPLWHPGDNQDFSGPPMRPSEEQSEECEE